MTLAHETARLSHRLLSVVCPLLQVSTDIPQTTVDSGPQVAILALDGNSGTDGPGRSVAVAAGMGTKGGFMVLLARGPVIKARLPLGISPDPDRRLGQAGTGGARSRANAIVAITPLLVTRAAGSPFAIRRPDGPRSRSSTPVMDTKMGFSGMRVHRTQKSAREADREPAFHLLPQRWTRHA